MSKKVYTKVFGGFVACTGIDPDPLPASIAWLMQDDIEVIGAECILASSAQSQNDGQAWAKVELSQTAVISQAGQILEAQATAQWNTTPAGVCDTAGHAILSLPAGYAIPVKEEGYLYVNFGAIGRSAGTDEWMYKVIIYYIRTGK